MSDSPQEKPRIIVDDDWKEQARKEKEQAEQRLKEEEGRRVPPPHLGELVEMLVLQASIGLGGFRDPQSGQRIPPDLPVAKHYIDLLELLQTKTRGNLTEEEARMLEGTLHELRLAFVQVAGLGAGRT